MNIDSTMTAPTMQPSNEGHGQKRGPMPPGVRSQLSTEQQSQVQDTLKGLSSEQKTALKEELGQLKETAKSQGLDLQSIASSFLTVLSEVSGIEINSEIDSKISAGSDPTSHRGPPPGSPPEESGVINDSITTMLESLTAQEQETLNEVLDSQSSFKEGTTSPKDRMNSLISALEVVKGEDLSDVSEQSFSVYI